MLTTSPDGMFVFNDWQLVEWGINSSGATTNSPASIPFAESAKFSDYNVEAISLLQDRVVLPDFEGRDNWARNFRTRIRDGMLGGTNFAGQFAVVEIGCGTSCRFAYVGDLITGEVFSFPYGGEEQYEMSLLYVPESRLIKARWATYDLESCVNQDLEFRSGEFFVLSEHTTPRNSYCNGPE